ncbi:MAG: ABC transporter permease [Hespellia sp.]|nr:ABC transporter permease [Hespellia sp.]
MERTAVSRWKQTKINIGICFRGFINEKGWKIFISVALISILICMVTGEETFVSYNATRSGAFALICACIWIGIFNSIRTICREREIIKREHRTGMHISSYVMAHWIYEAVLCLAEAVLVTAIVRVANMGHFIESGVLFFPLLELYITFFLTIFSSDALGLLISSIVKNENTAMTVMPFALIIQLVMSGMIFELTGLPELISAVTISRWGLAAICTSANVNRMSYQSMADCDPTGGNLLWLWLVLLGFAVLYGALSIIALEFVDNSSR